MAASYQATCLVEWLLDASSSPFYVVYVDDLDTLMQKVPAALAPGPRSRSPTSHSRTARRPHAQSIWSREPGMFVAIDPHVRRFPELKRLDMGWVMYPSPLRGDWTKQRIFKVRNDRLVDEGAFADAISFFDKFDLSVDTQTSLRISAAEKTSAYDAACEWLQQEDNKETWESWIVCTDCPDACKALAATDPENACLQIAWNDGVVCPRRGSNPLN